jgi:hypothetical protein
LLRAHAIPDVEEWRQRLVCDPDVHRQSRRSIGRGLRNDALSSGDKIEMECSARSWGGSIPSEILCELWSINLTRIPIVTNGDTASSAIICSLDLLTHEFGGQRRCARPHYRIEGYPG